MNLVTNSVCQLSFGDIIQPTNVCAQVAATTMHASQVETGERGGGRPFSIKSASLESRTSWDYTCLCSVLLIKLENTRFFSGDFKPENIRLFLNFDIQFPGTAGLLLTLYRVRAGGNQVAV